MIRAPGRRPRKQADAGPYRFHTAMPAYWEFLRANSGAAPESAGERFAAAVVDPHRQVFTPVAAGWLKDRNLGRLVRALEGQSEQLHRADTEFRPRFDEACRRFGQEIADPEPGAQIFLLPAPRSAVGGAVRPLKDQDVVVFGAEEIAVAFGSKTGFNVLVHHELTHLYRMQVNPEIRKMIAEVYMPPYGAGGARLYQVLWLEGLAVHVSKVLNPTAPDKEVFLSDSVAADVKAMWPRIGADFREHLDSTEKADIDAYLFDNDSGGRIPKRTGYCVGMLVAQRLAKEYTIPKLCRLTGSQLRAEIERALRDLEKQGIVRD